MYQLPFLHLIRVRGYSSVLFSDAKLRTLFHMTKYITLINVNRIDPILYFQCMYKAVV